MPKVTDEHLAARREQVLVAAWACFAREGFHATTMGDVIGESGLSAGAVYRYFPSKESLIVAAAERALGIAQQEFDAALHDADPLRPDLMLAELIARVEVMARRGPTDVTRLALQAWAEALRSPAVRDTADRAQTRLRASLAAYVRRCRHAGGLPVDADPAGVAQTMLSLVVGFIVQRLLSDGVDGAGYAHAISGLLGHASQSPPR